MSDKASTTPEEFYLSHCEKRFETGRKERAAILEAVNQVSERAQGKREQMAADISDIKKKVFNGFAREIEIVDDKVSRIQKILLGVVGALGIAVLAVVGDLIYDNIKARDQVLPPAVVRQLEEFLRQGSSE